MVLQVAYRHQTFGDLEFSALRHCTGKTSTQVFIGIKVYDDDKFRIFAQTRYDHNDAESDSDSDVYSSYGKLLSITEFTDEKISIPAITLYGASVRKGVPDFV